MREVVFLKKNEKKWREVEKVVDEKSNLNPDEIADLFIEMTDDLSYSKTNYPESNTTEYLNSLAIGVFQKIQKNKREKFERFLNFWRFELPIAFARSHKQLLYSFLVFALSVAIGVVSTAYDETFPRVVLGDSYVERTMDNIEKGDPMAIYKDSDETAMFFGITLNNIRVASLTFVAGIFFSIGTYYLLFTNGVMLGTFQYFFYTKGLFLTSFLTIWIHGTIEISSIIMAGTAGIVLGNSMLFPGTYKRKVSLVKGAKKALKISLGLIPLIILAGFLESFVTRLTDTHWLFRFGIIATSFIWILWYFVIYPRMLINNIELTKTQRYILFGAFFTLLLAIVGTSFANMEFSMGHGAVAVLAAMLLTFRVFRIFMSNSRT